MDREDFTLDEARKLAREVLRCFPGGHDRQTAGAPCPY